MASLLSVQEAQAKILALFAPVSTEHIPLAETADRILAEEVRAPGDLPPFANSSMDGFAVRAADVEQCSKDQPARLEIVADIPAGFTTPVVIQPGQAARIMTGAALPAGADAVVPVEDTDFAPHLSAGLPTEPEPAQVSIYQGVQPGMYVRPRGQDVREGQLLLSKGRKLQPQDIGVLASVGQAMPCVYKRPRVALFSTGDELIQPGQPLGPGQIYDSNGYVLAAMLEREGAEVLRLGTVRDDPALVEALLDRAVDEHVDLIVTSAGVSVGAFDYVRQVIEARGSVSFWKVNMRPGKPLMFASYSGLPILGLPGNPVSAFVGCRIFVLPVVHKLSGLDQVPSHRDRVILAEAIESDGRESYLRAVVRDEGGKCIATLTGHQGSGNLYSLVQANALLIVPSGVKSLPSGSEVEVWYLDE